MKFHFIVLIHHFSAKTHKNPSISFSVIQINLKMNLINKLLPKLILILSQNNQIYLLKIMILKFKMIIKLSSLNLNNHYKLIDLIYLNHQNQ